ncbi:hypothetical protein [Pantoea agglomerans]|uniref:hypothetical protein n=1 Tax=Enterobacter agglomerans TaxID=549 RepID=UPI0017829CB1|nr:hypothetical protein [Pantoea agglomerans]MBD8234605.1 hypothetical protein [Pantoea agglomerans]
MKKNKEEEYYYFYPFAAGSVSRSSSGEITYVVDVLSRDDIVYFNDGAYLIKDKALNILKSAGLTGVKVDHANVKFSAKHNMRYKKQTLPKYYRSIPQYLEGDELKEMFLDEAHNLVINRRIKKAIAEPKLRLKRAKYIEVNYNDVVDITQEDEEPVFKAEAKSTLKQVVLFIVAVGLIAAWFFHRR